MATQRLPLTAEPEPGGALGVGTVIGERYTLVELIGRGGMAVVYRARDERLGRDVACKIINDAGAPGSLIREDRALAQLAHPHIVSVYDSGTLPDGRTFLVLEYVVGAATSTLAPLPVGRALQIAEQVASALTYAHERGIVHCDVTPQNILIDAHGQAKLTDFGVASATATAVGETVYGSAGYVAPERLRGAPTDPAVDIYALGATLRFLLTGSASEQRRHERADPPAVVTTPLVPTVPPQVEAVLQRAQAADPAERFPTAAAFGAALAAARAALGPGTPTTPLAPHATPTARPRRMLGALLLGALLLGLIGMVALARHSSGGVNAGSGTQVVIDAPGASPSGDLAPASEPVDARPVVVNTDPPTPTPPSAPQVVESPPTAAPQVVDDPPTAVPTSAPEVAPPAPANPNPGPAKPNPAPAKPEPSHGGKGKDKKDK